MYDNPNPNHRAYLKHRNKLSIKPIIRNFSIPFCWLILSLVIIIIQIKPAYSTDMTYTELTPDQFKTKMDEVWNPIKDQYLPYALGLMAIGLMFRKL